jgi:hypothetical protein
VKRAEIEAKLSEHDRANRGIQTLIRTGMRLILKVEQTQLKTDEQLSTLQQAQQKTDEQLRAFIESLRRGGNGHSEFDPSRQ